jgi:hypothetical protein
LGQIVPLDHATKRLVNTEKVTHGAITEALQIWINNIHKSKFYPG